MTPDQKASTGINEKARDKLIRGLTMTKPATPMMTGYSRASFLELLAERDRFKDAFLTSSAECERVIAERDSLKFDRARLIEALGDAERRFKIASEEDISDSTCSEWAHEARSLLRELESK